MSNNLPLDWAVMAVSLFNTILLLWLGLTVLLNADRRTAGIWVAGGMLLMGGVFFLSHTIILESGLTQISQSLDFWWHLGWFPVVILPYAWYGVLLWYAGFWSEKDAPLRRRHRLWFYLTSGLAGVVIVMLFTANPLPSFFQIVQLDLSATPALLGVPLIVLVYPVYTLLCLGLSLDVLRHPAPNRRLMGDLARQRARPWLMAATSVLVLVSLLVGWVMLWVINQTHLPVYTPEMTASIASFDLAISSLIAAAGLLAGQAIISYEAFTGKSLPRRGLRRYWLGLIVLAGGYAVLAGGSLVRNLPGVYLLLGSAVIMTAAYALLSWRSFIERDSYLEQLQMFASSQELYNHLISSSASTAQEARVFEALCNELLETSQACLVPTGALAALADARLVYPAGQTLDVAPPAAILAQTRGPQTLCLQLDAGADHQPRWAVPLWSPRGLDGVLYLGAKRDGGLYSREEIEVARSVCERLIDLQASSEMARRLMVLQRQRLAESQVLDQRARRALHDEVLPRIHAVMLSLPAESGDALSALEELHRLVSGLLRELPASTAPEVTRLGFTGALQQAVQVDYKDAFDQVTWEIAPEAEGQLQALPPLSAEVLYYACREVIRNAARHGRASKAAGALNLHIQVKLGEALTIQIEDNGGGMNQTADPPGGQGLALHSTLMAVLGGSLAVESIPNTSTRVVLSLPNAAAPAAPG